MAKYTFRALTLSGKEIYGTEEAVSHQAIIDRLQNAGYLPIDVSEVKNIPLLHLFTKKRRVPSKDLMLLMEELATLLEAGLPLDHALKRMQDLVSNIQLKQSLKEMLENIHQGESLASAMMKTENIFDALQINMVKAGEVSGHLATAIAKLAVFLQKMNTLKSAVTTALIYPALLFVMSMISLFIMISFVVPQFIPMFEGSEQQLPALTAFVFASAEVVTAYWWLVLLVFIVLALSFDFYLRDQENRKNFDKHCVKLAFIGPFLESLYTARFARTLGSLLENGVGLIASVELARGVINNKAVSASLAQSVTDLEQGKKLGQTLRNTTMFPELLSQLVEVGEESGNLELMLLKAADLYDKEVEITTKRLLAILEPVLIIGLGIIIGVIIVSILLAMLSLNDLVV